MKGEGGGRERGRWEEHQTYSTLPFFFFFFACLLACSSPVLSSRRSTTVPSAYILSHSPLRVWSRSRSKIRSAATGTAPSPRMNGVLLSEPLRRPTRTPSFSHTCSHSSSLLKTCSPRKKESKKEKKKKKKGNERCLRGETEK